MRIINHLPVSIVPRNWRATESLENSILDFLRSKSDQPIESIRKTFECFARQPSDKVRMDMYPGLVPQKSQVLFKPRVILSSSDQLAHLFVECLNAYFELQSACRESGDYF